MARSGQKDLLSRLADAGEEAIGRLADIPGGNRVLEAVHALRDRIDELQSRMRSLDPLERKVAQLEKRLDALEGKKTTRGRRTTTTTTAKKKS
jgi:hypothetical protein